MNMAERLVVREHYIGAGGGLFQIPSGSKILKIVGKDQHIIVYYLCDPDERLMEMIHYYSYREEEPIYNLSMKEAKSGYLGSVTLSDDVTFHFFKE